MNWKDLEAATDKAVFATFGETVRHSPLSSSGAPDTTRSIRDFRAVLHTPTPAGTINLANGIVTTISASESALVLNRADYPDIAFKVKDKIRGLELPGQPWWEIKTVNDRFSGVIILSLNQV